MSLHKNISVPFDLLLEVDQNSAKLSSSHLVLEMEVVLQPSDELEILKFF